MIDAKDLRIGNWVMGIYKPTQIVGEDFKCDPIDCKPIPLTEYILLKCEGMKREWNSSKTHLLYIFEDKISVIKLGNQWSIAIQSDTDLPRFIRYVEYLHTFQNVIFALTQKELTVQL